MNLPIDCYELALYLGLEKVPEKLRGLEFIFAANVQKGIPVVVKGVNIYILGARSRREDGSFPETLKYENEDVENPFHSLEPSILKLVEKVIEPVAAQDLTTTEEIENFLALFYLGLLVAYELRVARAPDDKVQETGKIIIDRQVNVSIANFCSTEEITFTSGASYAFDSEANSGKITFLLPKLIRYLADIRDHRTVCRHLSYTRVSGKTAVLLAGVEEGWHHCQALFEYEKFKNESAREGRSTTYQYIFDWAERDAEKICRIVASQFGGKFSFRDMLESMNDTYNELSSKAPMGFR